MKVLIAGFKHETNSFATNPADWAAFERGEIFPRPAQGEAMLKMVNEVEISATGFVREAVKRGWEMIPSLWCGAVPSAPVTDAAFEKVCNIILADAQMMEFDAIYLELHGAAMTDSFDDAEGELLKRLRDLVGPDMPIVASIDLHANVTAAMLQHADAVVAFRTYPHVDYVRTGERAAEMLERLLANGGREPLAWARLPYLISVNMQGTASEPAKGSYELLEAVDRRLGTVSSFCMAFPASDFDECAPTVFSYGEKAHEALNALMDRIAEPTQWRLVKQTADEAVARAMQRAASSPAAVVIADTQDNPGIGGTGSTTGVLHALRAAGAGRMFPGRVAVGVVYDPDAAARAHAAGFGAEIEGPVGEQIMTPVGPSEAPLTGRFRVIALSDGRATFRGPKMRGFTTELGPSACLEIEGIRIIVAGGRIGAQDRELFRMVGINPEAMKIVVVKSSHHFRADFEQIVETPETDILFALSPGMLPLDPAVLPWKKLSKETRLTP